MSTQAPATLAALVIEMAKQCNEIRAETAAFVDLQWKDMDLDAAQANELARRGLIGWINHLRRDWRARGLPVSLNGKNVQQAGMPHPREYADELRLALALSRIDIPAVGGGVVMLAIARKVAAKAFLADLLMVWKVAIG